MSAVIGALVWDLNNQSRIKAVNEILNHIVCESHERGRDGRGYVINAQGDCETYHVYERDINNGGKGEYQHREFFTSSTKVATFLSNINSKPTTELDLGKSDEDQQPYVMGRWAAVHNGVIANSENLRTYTLKTKSGSAAILETLATSPCNIQGSKINEHFLKTVDEIIGSYAILATHNSQPNQILLAANYKPIWYLVTEFGVFFASSRNHLPSNFEDVPKMIEPYTAASFCITNGILSFQKTSLREKLKTRRALVVCSGGLDSVVAATHAQRSLGYDIHLIHFMYGCRAEGPEVQAVRDVAKALDVGCTLFPLHIYDKKDSPLLQNESDIKVGKTGAQYAHEWVPARNLLLLSVATAYAEANGFDTIVLGNNLEEAGAYPDNEPEFIDRFNDLLPFAVGDGKQVKVIMPVGDKMKHEIVKLGNEIGAPLDKTWSCYKGGMQHCGACGPCFMRRKAFEINNLPEVIQYEEN